MERLRTELICKICGKRFYPKGGHLKQKTCSKKCGYILRSQNGSGKKGKHYSHLKRAKIRKCIICGKEFRAVNDFHGKNGYIRKQKYCSRECWDKRNPPEIKECLLCRKEFKIYKRETKYCSNKCRDLDYRERLKGSKSHFWEGGKTKKSKLKRTCAEYKEWRLKVFKRDNFTCVICGKKNKTIEADHIKAQSEYPELIYDVNNGRTLCHKCHKKTSNYGHRQRWGKKEKRQ